ncbi:MAG: hypothetical protein IT444_05455 [Phycisphaeraceae bacterium]|nr:hypothetical protein [Phycisphaeraceae bacterium]
MSASTIINWFDDALNPIVIKELRQAVRSRFVTIVLSLFLLLAVLIVGTVLLSSSQRMLDPWAGRDVLMVLHAIVLATCLLFVPAYTGIRISAERSDTNVDLLFITTIRPRSIVWGKFWSSTLLAGLIYSSCLPFMTLTYLLRGVDLITMVVLVAADCGVIMASIMLAILIGCLGLNLIVKLILGLVVMFGLLGAYIAMMEFSDDLLRFGVGAWLGADGFLLIAGLWFSGFVAVVLLLAFLAIAVIKPVSANRALPVRVLMTILWLLGYLVIGVINFTISDMEGVPIWIWSCICLIPLGLNLFVATAERNTWGMRVRRQIPRSALGRAVAFLFFSGAAGGILWTLILAAFTLLAFPLYFGLFLKNASGIGGFPEWVLKANWAAAVTAFYLVAYALTAVLIRSYLLHRWFKPITTPVIAAALMAIFTVVPIIIAFIFSFDPFDQQDLIMLGNPLAPLIKFERSMEYLYVAAWVAIPWAIVAAVLSLPWMRRQMREFRRPDQVTPTP